MIKNMKFIRRHPRVFALLAVTIVSLLTHFAFFGQPKQAVFDEVYFGKFISSYYTHQYYFDIHPPLGKLLITGFATATGYTPTSNFDKIGTDYTDNGYMTLRFLPSLAGAMLPVVLFFLALELGFSLRASTATGLLIALENALVVQSRFILLDSFLLLFGFGSLLLYFIYRRNKNVLIFVLAGLLGGASASIKWTGLTFLVIPLIFELITNWGKRKWLPAPKTILRIVAYLIPAVLLYFSVFMIHFSLLTQSGTGDNYMSPEFQHSLIGNTNSHMADLKTENMFEKFIELNRVMYQSNTGIATNAHPYGSRWYTWPIMQRTVYYWQGTGPNGTVRNIYLLGNPVIWYAALIGMVGGFIGIVTRKIRATGPATILYAGYIINLLPFMQISRVMFLYHYLTALVFSILILVYMIDRLPRTKRNQVFNALLVLAGLSFLYFAPLTYGTAISPSYFNSHFWLKSWR